MNEFDNDAVYIDISDMIDAGTSLDEAYDVLKSFEKVKGKLAKAKFNDQYIYSDWDINKVYETVTGKSKTEFASLLKKQKEEYEQKQEKAKTRIPEWIEKGHKAFDKSKWKEWDECVPIRAGDIYCGMELDNVLEINRILKTNTNDRFKQAKDYMDNQGHSGCSWHLVCCLIKAFCDEKDGDELLKVLEE